MLFEMPVKGEGRCNPQKPHGFKTHAINKTQLFPLGGNHDSHCGMMHSIVNPFNPENRNNIFLKHLYRCHPQTVLHESGGFHKNIVGCYEGFRGSQNILSDLCGPGMIRVVHIQNRNESRRIDKNAHSPKASVR